MSEIKPIETVYKGYRFRSRLEARWAVFFDEVGIDYEYEPEGFDLKENGYYLPDFYLPWFKCYVEIKRKDYEYLNKAKNKLWELYYKLGNRIMMLCCGDPYEKDVTVICFDETDGSAGDSEWKAWFYEGAHFRVPGDIEYADSKHTISLLIDDDNPSRIVSAQQESISKFGTTAYLINYRSNFDYARICARQARFEHGETPEGENR